jgi:lambda family phage portal protein
MSRRNRNRRHQQLATLDTSKPDVAAMGGALEGADRTSRELASWNPSRLSPDQIINGLNGIFGAKTEADFRGRDTVTNDGYAQGIVDIHRDSIVGTQFRLNSQPSFAVLQSSVSKSFDDVWAEEFQQALEDKFNLMAESNSCWFDASRVHTFTGLVRLAIAGFVYTGEVVAPAQWIRELDRPFNTAVQMISPARLSNPFGQIDSAVLRNGVLRDSVWGKPIEYYIRDAYPTEFYQGTFPFTWTTVPAEKPWGRRQMIHIKDPIQPSQTRGISELTAVLKQMRMTKQFQDVVLQSAVVNASYAATIESELPSDVIAVAMGQSGNGVQGYNDFIGSWLTGLQDYMSNSNNIAIDGTKMPHLYPGTKLNMKPLGTPGGVGTEFEVSLLRHVAAGLNLSYEELANDFSKTNYSSGKSSMLKTQKHLAARKKFVADRFATDVFQLYAEEDLNAGNLPMPRNYDWRILYNARNGGFYTNSVVKEALFNCSWVGAGRGQIDELKETQAALLRIAGGLSTWESEVARQGGDYRAVFRQRAREDKLALGYGITFDLTAVKPTAENDLQGNQSPGKGSAVSTPVTPVVMESAGPSVADMTAALVAAVREIPAPIINVPDNRGQKTTVTKHDAQGRILEFVRESV